MGIGGRDGYFISKWRRRACSTTPRAGRATSMAMPAHKRRPTSGSSVQRPPPQLPFQPPVRMFLSWYSQHSGHTSYAAEEEARTTTDPGCVIMTDLRYQLEVVQSRITFELRGLLSVLRHIRWLLLRRFASTSLSLMVESAQ